MRIVVHQLFHRLWAVIDHLEKNRSALRGHAAKRADDGVVDEFGNLASVDRFGAIGIEDFEEVAKAFSLGFETKVLVLRKRLAIQTGIVVERDAVQAEVRP